MYNCAYPVYKYICIVMTMSRRGILEVTEEILEFLSDGKEYSINEISTKLKLQWRTSVKSLEFLEKVGLVREKKGNVTYKAERLFIKN